MHQSNTFWKTEGGSGFAYQYSVPVFHAGLGASEDIMKGELQDGKDADLASMQPTLPNYWPPHVVNPGFKNVTASVAHENDHRSYMAGAGGQLASMMGVQLPGGGNVGWNNNNTTVPPAANSTDFMTDNIYNGEYQSQAINSSWNMLHGQAASRNEGSNLIGWAPCFPPCDAQFASLSVSVQAIVSGTRLVERTPVLLNVGQKAQGTQHRLRGRGKDRTGGIFPCKECEMTFRGRYELKRHLNQTNKHGGPKFKCNRCGDLLSRRDALEKHKSNPRACRVK